MKKFLIAAGLVAVAGYAFAGEMVFATNFPLFKTSPTGTTFALQPGGCLIGPAIMKQEGGEMLFEVRAGARVGDCGNK